MTAVAVPPDYERKLSWHSDPTSLMQSIQLEETKAERMLRKSAQRDNPPSSISSSSSSSSLGSDISTETFIAPSKPLSQMNGGLGPAFIHDNTNGPPNPNVRIKKTRKMWPNNKPSTAATTVGNTTGTALAMSANQVNGSATSHLSQAQSAVQQTSIRQATQGLGEATPLLYLLSMNGTFERKTISVPIYPEVLRIGRQTNQKTLPTPQNGYFDSKVLSRQHAEVWAERNGKVWIRDVRSSNGTFVNGTRLSAENRDSEPHELQSQDHLELGIDIVSEDQKTVVHHKVAAKVEHAGFPGSTTNVLDMSFGDLDPAHGVSMVTSQNGVMRGRTNSQMSINNTNRVGNMSVAASNNMSGDYKRPMNFWLNPVSTESIVKRLQNEMREARRQNVDLEHAAIFVSQLAEGINVKASAKTKASELLKAPHASAGSLSSRKEIAPRFSEPPAPPPKQPLPEKPDVPRQNSSESQSPSIYRSHIERPKSLTSMSPTLSMSSPSHSSPELSMTSLVEALQQARREIDAQTSKVKNLEGLLHKERQAREMAEGIAKGFELARSSHVNEALNDFSMTTMPEGIDAHQNNPALDVHDVTEVAKSDAETTTTKLQERLDTLLSEMQDMKQHMESYRHRAEVAEVERDESRKSLAEMVSKLRKDDLQRPDSQPLERLTSKMETVSYEKIDNVIDDSTKINPATRAPMTENHPEQQVASLPTPDPRSDLLHQSTPYASMLGVVLLGMGIMAYLNGGFQKVDGR